MTDAELIKKIKEYLADDVAVGSEYAKQLLTWINEWEAK
tara:strand:+ start:698 stop:814 length:117 start_codon:yes stop_codon:yes gene_type:complete